jgi:hypothetical protein
MDWALQLAIDDCDYGGRKLLSIVNLNHQALVAARAAALDVERTRVETPFRNRHASREERARLADALLARDRFPSFVSIRAAWLRKQLGRGKP